MDVYNILLLAILERKYYNIVYLNILSINKGFNTYFTQSFLAMISVLNKNRNGINDHTIFGIIPILHDISDLKKYVEIHVKDEDILAFIGTVTYLLNNKFIHLIYIIMKKEKK